MFYGILQEPGTWRSYVVCSVILVSGRGRIEPRSFCVCLWKIFYPYVDLTLFKTS